MKFVHYLCLKTWLYSAAEEKVTAQIISYYWKTFRCEICTAAYPFAVMHRGRRFSLVDVPRPLNGDFLLLESISKDKGDPRAIYLIIPGKLNESYKLGRGHEADIKMSDISVSRSHAVIKSTKDGFTIRNNNAKFGTLLHTKRKTLANLNEASVLQLGKTKIVAIVKEAEAYCLVE
eukprot:TRINITY_DN5337_c0_g3_i1.p1 TRINITY_DN5337_c0_g3~~TRINITY_DN5337_c0_g3_i1.p1  ORF type:complete len:176 (+),score=39.32 TRINITY_DN5337_c0_g3_i1:796-1323(+)